ncbi:MAG TPA: gephyrin-like molybdotransferase Glp [Cellulomonas sp.]|uniref:molybdopterin molybdotransferase MoeA n=1 Tax=Cellulomonas sp. TaxID=40001 RepID=UPI002E375338|nr:gephyrin-like molybdotransferase Glp [Cellulomonas sp.]HEX5333086.1 gephyrin-like molybdotransferase Glp [Cellulomonas sp.]
MSRTVTEHREAVLDQITPTPAVTFALEDAAGLVLAGDVTALEALPRFDGSAMDGYAVQSADVASASAAAPVRLRVVADLAAGTDAAPVIGAGTAARIMTGAPVPPGADTVVPIEDTDGGTDEVEVRAPAPPGRHVRRVAEDVAAGDVVLRAGQELTPYRIAAVAAVGRPEVVVHRRPVVVVISTGSELVTPGVATRRGQIPDSNSYLLAAAARAAGAQVHRLGAVRDDAHALAEALESAGAADLIVTSGGVSVGAYDVVKEVLAPMHGMFFVSVAMQPGKPQGYGRLADGTPVIALPGNPVSAFVSFEAFVRPAILALRGLSGTDLLRPTLRARVEEGWSSPTGREQHMPVTLVTDPDGTVVARPAAARGSGSHLVASLAAADGLAVVPADVTRVSPGEMVTVVRITA